MDHGKTLVYGNNLFRFGDPEPSFSPRRRCNDLTGVGVLVGRKLWGFVGRLKIKSRPWRKPVLWPSSELCILVSLRNHRKPLEIYEEMLRSMAGRIETAGVTMTLLNATLREIVGYRLKRSILCLLVGQEEPRCRVPGSETTWYGEGLALKRSLCRYLVAASNDRGAS